ncbi:hypothetical protein I3F58_11755 [Streptomyces sp. MUM 203J]|uniref:hypothetical protein n=1 Tax=Streptomyces sp. MUM 203J TaxID=2791990 RepID=UPI001F04D67E|nr:hypothetical protein [Streptomyces sp. MUM 203J]MCH0540233.1 hypothetical protein [Streptomyces sp. MUM 203J]
MTSPRKAPPPGAALRRLVRQDKGDTWAVRLLPRIVFGLAGAYTLFVLASASMASFITVGALVLLGLLVFLLRRRGQLLLALASTLVTAAVVGYMAAVADIARGVPAGWLSGQALFGYWALAGMALLGAWMPREHPGRRGVTVVLADVVLVVASGVGTVVPAVSVPLGFAGVVAVLMARGGGITAARRVVGRVARRVRKPVS